MDEIKFANGSVFDCPFLSTLPDGTAFVALSGVTFAEAARIFADETMTREMEWNEYRLLGYTELVGVYVEPYGFQAMLKGGHDERID